MESSKILAIIVPITSDAEKALNHRHNGRYLRLRSTILSRLYTAEARKVVARVDRALLLGRRCITIGSSRTDDIRLDSTEVLPRHFVLQFDMSDGSVHITDNKLYQREGISPASARPLLAHFDLIVPDYADTEDVATYEEFRLNHAHNPKKRKRSTRIMADGKTNTPERWT